MHMACAELRMLGVASRCERNQGAGDKPDDGCIRAYALPDRS